MGKFQLHSLTKPRFAKLWKLLALFSLRIMGVAKAYDFGSRKRKSAKDVDSHCEHRIPPPRSKGRFIETASKKPLTGEQVRWGLENLTLTADQNGAARQRAATDQGLVRRSGRHARWPIQTWDGKKWNLASGWITSDDWVIAPMVNEAAAKYAAEKKITTGCG